MKRLVFFGAGNISQAIIGGLIDGGYSKDNIAYVDRNKSNSLKLKKQQVKKYSTKNAESSDIFVLAVKPKDALAAYAEVCSLVKKPKIVSLVAGLKSRKYLSQSNNVEFMRMTSTGSFGIGTATPTEKLDVVGNVKVRSSGADTTLDIVSGDGYKSVLRLYGGSQGTGQLYVGQSLDYGGGIEYNGDNSPSTTAAADYITLYRRSNGVDSWTARNAYSSNNWEFRGSVTATSFSGNASSATTAAACTGNSATATTLQTARTIGGVSFNGSANINLPGVNTTGNQNTSGWAATAGTVTTPAQPNITSIGTLSSLTIGSGNSMSKIRLWGSSSTYMIGMESSKTYGGLNDYAMTFTMNNDADRGFLWRSDTHTAAQGAMSLTTGGKLTVASNTRIGYGVGDTTTPSSSMLDVNGNIIGNGITCDNRATVASKDVGVLWLANGSSTSSSTAGFWTAWNDTSYGLRFEWKSVVTNAWTNKGYISKGSYTGIFNNFTGQHHNYGISELIDEKGFIVSSTGKYRNQMTNCDECNKYKISINESLPIVEYSQQVNDTKVWGVISDKDDTNTTREKPFGNFVTEYEQAEEDRPLTINSLGEGAVWVSNINGPITNGDYITTCVLPGLGMKQDDDVLHSYTVAKITTDCSFDEIEMVPRKKPRYETITKTREKPTEVEKDVFDYWEDDYDDETYYENIEQQIIDTVSKTIQEDIITYDVSGIPSVQVIEKTVEEEVPRVKQVESTDVSGNIITTEVPDMETVSITKTRKIPKMIDVILKDASNNDLLDSLGNPIIKQYQAKKAVYKKEITNETITESYDVDRAVIDPVTHQYVYDYETDNSGNTLYVEKYDMKYIVVSTDKFSVYNDGAHTDLYKEFPGDFTNTQINGESIIGKIYKMAFLGCTYHCG